MYISLMHAGTSDGANWHKDILNAWTPENTNTNVPKLNGGTNQTQALDPYMISASYFNLRNITLGYTLPQKMGKGHQDVERAHLCCGGQCGLAVETKAGP